MKYKIIETTQCFVDECSGVANFTFLKTIIYNVISLCYQVCTAVLTSSMFE